MIRAKFSVFIVFFIQMALLTCPRCNYLVDESARKCPNCGIDLGMAAILAEQSSAIPEPPQAPEALVPRLGEYLISKGVLDATGLQRALDFQQERAAAGQPLLIGQALLILGIIDRTTLDAAVTEQILRLQTTLQQANQDLERRVQERTADLQHALEKLTELNQLKSNFIANVSHELRTPLTHIKGYIDMLADESLGPLSTQQAEALRVLQRSETRLEGLINDLIQFSLAAKGALSTQVGILNLADLVALVLAQSKHKAASKQVTIQASIPPNLPPVLADEEKIGWVLMQLLDNGIKFNHPGGQVELIAEDHGDSIAVCVNDTGIGVPPERLEEVFEPFHQLDGSTTRRYPGTGLGLAMVKHILDTHGCPLRIQSEVGQGLRFEFLLQKATGENV